MAATIVRTTRSRALADEWSLVLTALGIDHDVASDAGRHTIGVDSADADSALTALVEYDREHGQPSAGTWEQSVGSGIAAWVTAAAILVFFWVTGPVSSHSAWFAAGAAQARAIRDGELWRCVTTLTLHADLGHVLSNAAAGALFLVPLSRLLGGGTAIALTIAAGSAANLVNVLVRTPAYTGIGASTGVFASLGILTALRLHGSRRPVWRRLRPIGAAVAILAMLGAAPTTDVVAHLLGLALGLGLGAAFTALRDAPLSPSADRALGVAAAVAVVAAWMAARGWTPT